MKRLRIEAAMVVALLAVGTADFAVPVVASAQTSAAQITGSIVSQEGGFGISGAEISLMQGPMTVATTQTDSAGNFAFANLKPGEYDATIRANGYTQTRIESIIVTAGVATAVRTPLRRAQTSATGGLTEIGRTNATSRASSLASTATIQYNLDPNQIQSQGFLKSGDAIGQLPGVNITGGPHTVGDDTSIDIRGMGAGEVRPLIDGHPIGPLGVYSPDYFNYNNTPYGLLDNIQVTYGSGAAGLYGVDVIGGTIDFQTLSPTGRPHTSVLQSFGNQGTSETLASATGTIGRLGYAVGHDVTGTYGSLAPGLVFQSARPNNNGNLQNGGACLPVTQGMGSSAITIPDYTSCNAALNTYSVSGNFRVDNDLAKLRYNFTPATALTITAYDSNTLADSTGNGDNDYYPYTTRLAVVNSSAPNCPGGYLAAIDGNPHACLSAQQFAADSSGPDGGGEDRNRGTSLQDFSARLTSQIGINALSLSAFSDYYNFHKNSDAAAGLDPTGTFLVGTGTYEDNYLTHGFLLTDDIATVKNDIGYGYFVEHQQTSGNNRSYNSDNTVSFVPQPVLGEGDYSFFLRDNYSFTDKLSAFVNAWDRRSSVTQHTTLDPRISLVYKATAHDVVRLTAGQADGDPAVSTVSANALSGITNPSSLNPTCDPLVPNVIASGGNPSLAPERSSDLEASFGHRFWADTSVNIVAYVSSVKDQIFSGAFPITPLALANPAIAGSLAGYASKIDSSCPGANFTAADVSQRLGLSGYFNSASALFRGIEASGRVRLAPWLRFDYSYDIQSSQQFGEPANVLINNPYILNGGQIYAIPVHKFNVGADYTGMRGYEAQLQLYYVGNNNTLNRPAYTYYNAFLSKTFSHTFSLTLSAYNLFNQNAQSYGYFGEQLAAPTNAYYTGDASAIGQVVGIGPGTSAELFGLQPRILTLQLNARI